MIDYQIRAHRISRNAIKLDHAVRDAEDFHLDDDYKASLRRYRDAAAIIDDQIALITLQFEAEREAGFICEKLGCGGPTDGHGGRLCSLHAAIKHTDELRGRTGEPR